MKNYALMITMLLVVNGCQGQTTETVKEKRVGGPCEGCEAIYEYGDKKLQSVDTLPGFNKYEPKIVLTGTVYKKDGTTPARDIILYIYHTNRKGIYEKRGDEKGWGTRHGYIRGWIKTDASGQYSFYTFRPAAYPNRDEPEHVHLTVKEPGYSEYYVDSFHFDDDPLLTAEKRADLKQRGGNGIVHEEGNQVLSLYKRDIILGLNIPDYH